MNFSIYPGNRLACAKKTKKTIKFPWCKESCYFYVGCLNGLNSIHFKKIYGKIFDPNLNPSIASTKLLHHVVVPLRILPEVKKPKFGAKPRSFWNLWSCFEGSQTTHPAKPYPAVIPFWTVPPPACTASLVSGPRWSGWRFVEIAMVDREIPYQ